MDKGRPLKGSLEECWRKDIKEFPLHGHVEIALDAERIVSGFCNELQIFNFNGIKERSIKVEKPISSMTVTSDCSRILVWTPRRGKGGDIVAYNPEGQIDLEVEPDEVTEEGILRTSLDGRLFTAKSREYIQIWDWNGNWLGGGRSEWGSRLFGGRAVFHGLDVAPNGSYTVWTMGGGGSGNLWVVVIRTPNIDDLLRISDLTERAAAWNANVEELDVPELWESTVCTASNRLALCKGRSIWIFDIIGDKSKKLLDNYELVSKLERIKWVKMTSDGRYLYYASRHGKVMSFNIFDVENKTVMRDLLTFPEGTSASFYLSHDGSKLITIEKKRKGWLSREITISMLNVD